MVVEDHETKRMSFVEMRSADPRLDVITNPEANSKAAAEYESKQLGLMDD